jgi:hypothetical protein
MRDDQTLDRIRMKSPVVIVTAALTVAILLAASFLIATGTRGENALARPSVGTVLIAPAGK